MKKHYLLMSALLMTVGVAKAQVNLQEQYDFNREFPVTTLEMFKGDNWGSTFFFVDIYHSKNIAPTDFYAEIARSLNFWKETKLGALSAHVEWNGGCGISFDDNDNVVGGYGVNNAWLFGAEYFFHSKDFRNTLTVEVMYKDIRGGDSDVPMQFTLVWGMNNLFGVKGLNFSGFADFWWETKGMGTWSDLEEETSTVFLTEPQLWYNVGQFFKCENLFIGGEVELSNNFTGNGTTWPFEKGFKCNPAVGIKWNF